MTALGNVADRKAATRLPSVVEVKVEAFHHLPHGTEAAPDPPFLLLLLADGTFLAYRAFVGPRDNVAFKRLSLPAFAHSPPLEVRSQRKAPSSSMTRFDGLGDSKEHLNR